LYFTSPTWGTMTIEEMAESLKDFLQEDTQAKYKVVIGTDSSTTGRSTIFVTALIIHRIGKGARFFFRKKQSKPIPDLRRRIYQETELSLELIELLKKKGIHQFLSKWPIEIHTDIGQHGETKKLIHEIVGWVTSVGYDVKIKPNAFGASAVADRFTS
jgi:predicted RNase H-related nuclease YkuK (DUF458 family)